jgi:hypothetical protein
VDKSASGTVTSFELKLADADLVLLDQLDLQVTYDGASTAAIDASVANIFAANDVPPEHPSLALAVSSQDGHTTFALRLPMPFRSQLKVSLQNGSGQDVDVDLLLRGATALPPEPFGHLRIATGDIWPPVENPLDLFDAVGPGRLVGTCLAMDGKGMESLGGFSLGHNYLEGDETIVVDGTTLQGTGTEDYFDSSFYFLEGSFGTAFAQGWGYREDTKVFPPIGQVSTCRWHLFHDAIDFSESIDFDLEVGPGDPDLLARYQSSIYYYQ